MRKTITDYRSEYGRADILLQEVQSFRNKAGLPAIIELRNAGHHLLRAIDDDGTLISEAELLSAVNHARRACYEATETGIIFAVALVRKFQDDYRSIPVSSIVPDYVSRIRRCQEALRLLEVGRRPDFDRDGDHQDRIDVFREIRPFCDDLDAAREEANKHVAAARVARRRFILQITIATIALAATVSFGVWASTGYQKFWVQGEVLAKTN